MTSFLQLLRNSAGLAKRTACILLSATAMLAALLPLTVKCAFGQAQTSAQPVTSASEDRVEAAFLYNFLSYAERPAASFAKPDDPYVIGIVNTDDIADEIFKIAAVRKVNERSVVVRKLTKIDNLDGIHVLFIPREEHARRAQLLRLARKQPLTVVLSHF